MKKILTLALLVGIALFASSCKKEVTQVIQPNQTIVFPLKSSDWTYDTQINTWTATIDMPEIDNYAHDNGGVLIYLDRNNGGQYEQLPMLYDQITYSYSTSPGTLRIDAQYYDAVAGPNAPPVPRPLTSTVKVILIDSLP